MSRIFAKPGAAYDALRQTPVSQISASANLAPTTVDHVFRGGACQVSTARKLCQAIGCGFSDLFELRKGGGQNG